jgi:threonine synthase
MTMCPRCGSTFLQPLRCEAKGSDVVVVELRCPDCMTWLKAPHTRADMRELDRRQAEYRAEIVAQYERMVTESMEALADCLGTALALDLVSADDFATRRPSLGDDGGRERTVGA